MSLKKYKSTSLIKVSSIFFTIFSSYLIFNYIPADYYSDAIIPFISVGVIAKLSNIGYGQIVIHYYNKYYDDRKKVYSTILIQSLFVFSLISIILFFFNNNLFEVLNVSKIPNLFLIIGLFF